MIKYYKTEKQRIYEEQKADDGVWIQMVAPSMEESQEIA